MSENKTMEQHILKYLNTKPYKNQIIFNVRDIFIPPQSTELSCKIKGLRRSLATWMYYRMRDGPLRCGEFDISVYAATAPYRYVAVRV